MIKKTLSFLLIFTFACSSQAKKPNEHESNRAAPLQTFPASQKLAATNYKAQAVKVIDVKKRQLIQKLIPYRLVSISNTPFVYQGEKIIKYRSKERKLYINGRLRALLVVKQVDLEMMEEDTDHLQIYAGLDLNQIPSSKKLLYLELEGRKIWDADLKQISRFKHLKYLVINYCKGLTEKGLRYLTKLTNLVYLNLSGTNIKNEHLKILAGLKQLSTLYLANNSLTGGGGLKHLAGLKHLRDLNLASNPITNQALYHLKPFKHLRHINLSYTHITGKGLKHLTHLKKLTHLGLKNTLYFKGIHHLKKFTDLRWLDLSLSNRVRYVFSDLRYRCREKIRIKCNKKVIPILRKYKKLYRYCRRLRYLKRKKNHPCNITSLLKENPCFKKMGEFQIAWYKKRGCQTQLNECNEDYYKKIRKLARSCRKQEKMNRSAFKQCFKKRSRLKKLARSNCRIQYEKCFLKIKTFLSRMYQKCKKILAKKNQHYFETCKKKQYLLNDDFYAENRICWKDYYFYKHLRWHKIKRCRYYRSRKCELFSNKKWHNIDYKVLGTLKNLKTLKLKYIPLTNSNLSFIKNLKKLHHLDLSGSNLSNAGLKHIRDLTKLKHLDLSRTRITDLSFKILKKFKHLTLLNLKRTKIKYGAWRHRVSKKLKRFFKDYLLKPRWGNCSVKQAGLRNRNENLTKPPFLMLNKNQKVKILTIKKEKQPGFGTLRKNLTIRIRRKRYRLPKGKELIIVSQGRFSHLIAIEVGKKMRMFRLKRRLIKPVSGLAEVLISNYKRGWVILDLLKF